MVFNSLRITINSPYYNYIMDIEMFDIRKIGMRDE